MENAKKILLIDQDDHRRESRVSLLTHTGYLVSVRTDHVEAYQLGHEGSFDLIIVALHGDPAKATHYSDQLSKLKPKLPVLLLADVGVFVPPGTLGHSIETGSPASLIEEIARILAGTTHVRELPIPPLD